ncbi:MAG: 4,5:9,10-diseco-3-hydroxy-5,9,17-trioxoandrosta-1(10),2-diene-4-oate hydrolase [Acidimicrobiia bacterium]
MTVTAADLTYEATSRVEQAGDLKLHYHEAGPGPGVSPETAATPLVLLHGGGPGASAWSNWKQNIGPLAEHFRVLAVDQPGYGRSDKPIVRGGLWEFYARAVRDLLDSLGVESAHFIGNSLGGGTTLKLALDHPERAGRLILMGPAGGTLPITSSWPSEGLKTLMRFYAPPGPSRERMQDLIDVMMFDSSKVHPGVLEERYLAAVEPEAMAMAQAVFKAVQSGKAVMVAEELWRDVHRIGQRTLLTWGRDDRVLPLDGALFMLRYMPDARLHVFPNCGHWAQAEYTVEFNRLVVDFLSAP